MRTRGADGSWLDATRGTDSEGGEGVPICIQGDREMDCWSRLAGDEAGRGEGGAVVAGETCKPRDSEVDR